MTDRIVFPEGVSILGKEEIGQCLGRGLYLNDFDSMSPIEEDSKTESEMKINRCVSLYPQNTELNLDISEVLNLSRTELEERMKLQAVLTDSLFQDLQSRADTLQKEMAVLLLWKSLLHRKEIIPVEHTSNVWRPLNESYPDEGVMRSNAVYKMLIRKRVSTNWDKKLKKSVPSSWYVDWWIVLQNPIDTYQRTEKIAGQDSKLFRSEDGAEKYITGRKKAYDHLFTQDFPSIPKQYASHFMYMGALLPGYSLMEET